LLTLNKELEVPNELFFSNKIKGLINVVAFDQGRNSNRIYNKGKIISFSDIQKYPQGRIHTTAKSLPGNSGGVAVDEDGNFVGILASGDGNINEIIPIVLINDVLKNTKDKYKDQLNPAIVELLYKSAPMHDIGKVGVSDNILLKPGKLTHDEFDEMKKHTTYGLEVIVKAEKSLGVDPKTSFLRFAREIAYTHQEKWDGSGYPEGIKGEEIPLSGRIMAIADVYDALISKRVYKPALTHNATVKIIEHGKGTHFDPDVVKAFHEVKEEFRKIALHFVENEEERAALESSE